MTMKMRDVSKNFFKIHTNNKKIMGVMMFLM